MTAATATPAWNATKITNTLWVGGGITGAEEMAWLVEQGGVTCVISAARDLDDTALCVPDHVDFLHVPWEDNGQPKPVNDFAVALDWVVARMGDHLKAAGGGKLPVLYVHCAAGCNRGPMMATFLLAALSGVSADTAFAQIKSLRPQVSSFYQKAYRDSVLAALVALG